MKSTRIFPIAALMSSLFVAFAATASSPATATVAFVKLQSLAGDWEGKDADGNPARTTFKLAVANTAVLETLSMSGMEEMLTLYSIDKDGIALVHYCPTNNQPRMRATPQSETINELEFRFQGATNLPDPAVGHEQQLVIQFEDKDHITEQWTWRRAGKDTKMVYRFVRKADS